VSLASGVRLGAYEILSLIGAGGMGEVYRAHDTTLNRDVALKILPDLFALDPDRVARFKREAQVLASLTHPNIGGIYGFEEASGVQALVLELVEGPTLADRIAHGAIPLDEALPIARQIAEALRAAHEHGIVHRDLKPSNIKLRPEGTVKVLDFGLATAPHPVSSATDVSASPTITSPAMTRIGVILGTATYMSPEQAKGKALDKRSDIWTFGCVLYEMLTGKRAFGGAEIVDVLAQILEREPDFDALPSATPPAIRRLLRRSLEKDVKRRLSDIADAGLEIDEALTTPVDSGPGRPVRVEVQPAGWRRALPWALASALGLALGLLVLLWAPWRTPSPVAPQRLSAELGADASLATAVGPRVIIGTSVALSPNGSLLAFVAQKGITEAPQPAASALPASPELRAVDFGPRRNTLEMRRVLVMSSSGFPSSTTKSALLRWRGISTTMCRPGQYRVLGGIGMTAIRVDRYPA
jgi:hypothetical protein